ncbi:hypothetical protein ACFCZQ_31300, partial [Streptomyces virginiae]
AAHPAEAAAQAELLVLMVPFERVRGLLPPHAVQDKVLVDATNAFGGPGAAPPHRRGGAPPHVGPRFNGPPGG